MEHGPEHCDAPTVLEKELQEAVIKAINMGSIISVVGKSTVEIMEPFLV